MEQAIERLRYYQMNVNESKKKNESEKEVIPSCFLGHN
jgi:FtsZ-binding cell division protein ZapB